jgi:hypothetical protein
MDDIIKTGIYIRVKEDGKWQSKDIVDCEEANVREWLKGVRKDEVDNLTMILLKKLSSCIGEVIA